MQNIYLFKGNVCKINNNNTVDIVDMNGIVIDQVELLENVTLTIKETVVCITNKNTNLKVCLGALKL